MSNPYKDKSGHFTSEENNGGECVHTGKVYRQNTPYEEIIKNDLTKQKSKSIIQLPKSEYAIVRKQLFEMQVRAKREKRKLPNNIFISTANNCYFVSVFGDGFSVLQGYDIESDWDILQQERRVFEDDGKA